MHRGRLLKTEGSLLEDEALVVTLQSCKTTSADVTEQLETAEETEIKIDAAREVRAAGSYGLRLPWFEAE